MKKVTHIRIANVIMYSTDEKKRYRIIKNPSIWTQIYYLTFEYSAVKKGTFLTSHSKMLAIKIREANIKGKVPYIRYAN